MDFRDDANLDASQVEDVGGSGGGGGGGGGFPGGVVIGGGGIVSLIVLVVVFVLNNLSGGDSQPAQQQPSSNLSQQCRTGKDADQSEKCRVVGVVNSIQDYWKTQISDYRPAKTVLYSGSLRTPCGAASSAVGPFYCPGDQRVYLDLSFFNQLQSQFGAKGGPSGTDVHSSPSVTSPLAQAYVIAHEYGHHVQDELGTMAKVGQGAGAESGSVRLELQADCYAGVWTHNAYKTGFFEQQFTNKDIAAALDAAAIVGDDNIQKHTQGRIDPDSFTHGTSAQRVKWFSTGYKSGDPEQCDTFSGSI
ncbi:neutral zinc metallopeptidase [Nonomuraea sp. NEAU-A123]|uniref:KPN_02809 family neutral zinc metallopeptidase n=1 Tax=Nonomuraea sp. NEAU-A123 TaxID=2839649 RepID=UPI001BE48D95|nr:neutral zinc metallopeptidase [Nonomuraea sp. NEAU-A123]MBT2226224.1 neutral zinc metallopeptidase [Nonomuraea sp. NEAU-A123]